MQRKIEIYKQHGMEIQLCCITDLSLDDVTLWLWLRKKSTDWKYVKMLDICHDHEGNVHYLFRSTA